MEVTHSASPFLARFATQRTGSDDIPGEYCPVRHMWLVDGEPLVSRPSALAIMTTKTDANIERDDAPKHHDFLEMATKTLSAPESDDDDFGNFPGRR